MYDLGLNNFFFVIAVVVYSGQSAKAWYYIDLLFTVLVCLGGLFGILGSCFASRKFAKVFSVVVWVNCILSIVKYLVSLVLMVLFREGMVHSCQRSGFAGFSNAQATMSPAVISDSPYYAPVKYPNTLNSNAMTMEDCEASVKTFLISYGVIIFLVEMLQIYFASVVSAYASRLRNGARHHRLHDQQIKDFEESRYHMSTVY
ncbi:hypothetical protein DFQ28_003862 [Apophysomyces sp. BC1034]|nr:hypothetical protein DFQ30_001160 [Apophysomyces sp. BC1015]KAG0182196.1 hypothetical protein DFQ29_005412 [Apophysomyces sp. BC1021]KAG0193689.1 hypothetical protein DFQ28_003862 [Apophysomyces sp. BC1034]